MSYQDIENTKNKVFKVAFELIKGLTFLIANESNEELIEEYSSMLDDTVNIMIDAQSGELNLLNLEKIQRFLKYHLTETQITISNQEYLSQCDTNETVTTLEP